MPGTGRPAAGTIAEGVETDGRADLVSVCSGCNGGAGAGDLLLLTHKQGTERAVPDDPSGTVNGFMV